MRDRMHRRTGEAELQTLSADVVGPFAKADEHNYKYFLQAVFTIASQEECGGRAARAARRLRPFRDHAGRGANHSSRGFVEKNFRLEFSKP